MSGREELDGNDKGRWSIGGDVEFTGSLSRGIFWWNIKLVTVDNY